MQSSILRQAFARSAFRQRLPQGNTRFASNNASTEAAQKKAQETLASAQKNAGQFWESTKKFLEPAGQKVGQLLGCEFFSSLRDYAIRTTPCADDILLLLRVAYKQPLLYNLSVTREVLKQIYIAEGLQPPTSVATLRAAYETIWSRASSAAYWRGIAQSGEIARVGVYAVEAYGIFKVRVLPPLFSFRLFLASAPFQLITLLRTRR